VIMNVWVVATLALMTCTRDGHDHRINETPAGRRALKRNEEERTR
jgi:hypothetical protein